MSRPATFDSKLRRARDRAGISRERAAQLLDPPITSKTLERWERGDTTPPLWRLEQLAHAYGVSVRSLGKPRASANGNVRQSVYSTVRNALKTGALIRPDRCEDCGDCLYVQAHHEDYSKPLDVTWLCPACHTSRHESNGNTDLAKQEPAAATPQARDGLQTTEV